MRRHSVREVLTAQRRHWVAFDLLKVTARNASGVITFRRLGDWFEPNPEQVQARLKRSVSQHVVRVKRGKRRKRSS